VSGVLLASALLLGAGLGLLIRAALVAHLDAYDGRGRHL
jgi:hypothetical protein